MVSSGMEGRSSVTCTCVEDGTRYILGCMESCKRQHRESNPVLVLHSRSPDAGRTEEQPSDVIWGAPALVEFFLVSTVG